MKEWITRGLPAGAAIAVATVIGFNVLLLSPRLWRAIDASAIVRYAPYHPVAWELPNNLGPPLWAYGETVLLGASTIGASVPTVRTQELLGRPAWTVWCSGARPPEFLALAPYILRARPRHVAVCLEVRHAGIGGDNPFSRANRDAYVSLRNPAWPYHRAETTEPWPQLRTLPMDRFRASIRVLAGAYVQRARTAPWPPDAPAWERLARRYEDELVQAALAEYEADPTPDRYTRYLHLVGMTHAVSRGFWREMRALPPDPEGTGANARALVELTQYLRDRGVTVSWFLFPENPMCAQLTTTEGEVVAPPGLQGAAQELFARLAAREAVPFLDLLHLADASEFVDEAHLAPPAADRLAAELRAFLDAADPA